MTQAPAGAGQLRFDGLEALRGLMAWWVVFAHIAILTGINSIAPGYFGPLWRATVAVNVFMMLSGFVITHLQLSASRQSYGKYLARRAFRLWPAYLLALVPMIAIPTLYAYPYIELPWHSEHASNVEAYQSVHENVAPHVMLHLTLLHGLAPSQLLKHADSSLLSPAWSLSLEWQFYLVAPLLIALMLRSMKWAIGVLVGSAVLTTMLVIQTVLTWDFRSFLLSSIVFFTIGMFSRIYVREITAMLRSRRSIIIQVMLVITVLVLADGLTDYTLGRELALWLIALHAVANQIGASSGQSGSNRIGAAAMAVLSWRPLRHLGEISYSTYILHIPVIAAWFWLFGRGDRDLSQGAAIAIGLTSVVPVYLASLASHRLIERPFMQLGARLTRKSPLPRESAAPIGDKT